MAKKCWYWMYPGNQVERRLAILMKEISAYGQVLLMRFVTRSPRSLYSYSLGSSKTSLNANISR